MTIDAPAGVAIVETSLSDRDQSSYVDWPAIIAGIVLASAISLVLISFGSAVGLNFLDFGYGDAPNPIFVGIAAATWFLWVQISSFMAGGYLTGRLRRRYFDASEDESDLRDGAHGLLVWAGAAILGTIIAVGGVGAAGIENLVDLGHGTLHLWRRHERRRVMKRFPSRVVGIVLRTGRFVTQRMSSAFRHVAP